MSTSDQQGNQPLTRKQLREIRLTGATPVIGEEEAAAAAKQSRPAPAAPLPRAAEPAEVRPAAAPAQDDAELENGSAPLTRRQARAQERIRTASVPVIEPAESEEAAKAAEAVEAAAPEDVEPEAPHVADDGDDDDVEDVVSAVPSFAPVSAQVPEADETDDAEETEADTGSDAAAVVETVVEPVADDQDGVTPFEADVDAESDEFSTVLGVSAEQAEKDDDDEGAVGEGYEVPVEDAIITGERPVVSPAFGEQLLSERSEVPAFAPSFDELITADSGGSHHASNTLIFTPNPGEGSLSGPVTSTGEILVTGSYELPQGIGSQGHAHGTADGKDIDSVLIDGELPPASSPTPIAASSAVSTIKPAGEVIRPPAPEKGNKLMLTLAITAGGLALALAVALIVAFTTNVF